VLVETLIADLKAGGDFDVAITRQKILKEFDAAATADDRSRVLAVFKAVMDATECSLIEKNSLATGVGRRRRRARSGFGDEWSSRYVGDL
jgi:hypothetical protein